MKLKQFIFENEAKIQENFSDKKTDSYILEDEFSGFHLSNNFLGEEFVFTPRIPRFPYEDHNNDVIEDDFTPRVSLAISIQDAFQAISSTLRNGDKQLYIYALHHDDVNIVSIVDNIPHCPKINDKEYGTDFVMKKWLQFLDSKNEEEEDENELLSEAGLSPSKLISPLGKQFKGCVPDAEETNEQWVLDPVKLMCVGYLLVPSIHKFYPSKIYLREHEIE